MEILKKIQILLFPFIFTGCFEYFTPEEDTKPVLCINSMITAGKPIEVSVSHSWLFNDRVAAENHQVQDAKVSVYANDIIVGADYLPKEGDRIRITAESATYGKAEAEVEVPVSVPVESVDWTAEITDKLDLAGFRSTTDTKYYMNLNAKMTIKDPAHTENFYLFSYYGFPDIYGNVSEGCRSVSFFPGYFAFGAEPILSEHIGVLDAISGKKAYLYGFFSDRQFSGNTYTLNLQFEYMNVDIGSYFDSGDIADFGIILSLCTVSKSYYNWMCYEWTRDCGIIGELGDYGLGDPVCGYSNVSTGAGVVAAVSPRIATISLRDFLRKEIEQTP